jgi:hypothetical protein
VLFPTENRESGLRLPTGAPPADLLPKPGDGTVLGAAARQYNTLKSAYDYVSNRVGLQDEVGHEPLDIIRGTKYEQNYLENFVKSRSTAETKMIMAEIDQEEADKALLSKSGWAGTIASIGMGVLDPTILMPVGAAGGAIKGGLAALRVGGSVAAASALQASIQEGVLYGTHQTHTAEDVAMGVGSATMLGGLLGAGAGALLSRFERRALENTLHQDRIAMGNELSGQPASVNAAASDTRALELRSFGLDKIPGLGKIFDATGPLKRIVTGPTFRTFQKPFVSARRDMADLAETPLQFRGNTEGIATTQGPALDRQARMMIDGGKFNIADNLDRLYAKYRFGTEPEGYLGRQVAKVKGTIAAISAKPGDRLSPSQFREEVGRAMRRGDASEIPEVREAAETLRKLVADPIKHRAIAAKLFPEDVNVDDTAVSHFMRVYNKEALTAKRPEVQKDWADWLEGEQEVKAGLKSKLEANISERAEKTKKLRKLEGRLKTASLRQERIEAQLGERQMEATATERRFDTVEARRDEAKQAVKDIKEFIADLREQTDTPEIRKQIANLEATAKDLEGGMKAITEKDLEAIDKAERKGILTGPMRRVGRILTGKGSAVKGAEPFWKYVARLGGVKDDGGDLKSMLGEKVVAKGGKAGSKSLFNPKGFQWDDLQQKLADNFQTLQARGWGKEREGLAEDFSDEIRQAIVDSRNGIEPEWYAAEKGANPDDEFVVSMVNEFDRMTAMGDAPEFKTMDEFAKFFSGHHTGMTEADYDKIIASIDEGPASMDLRVAALDARNSAGIRTETIKVLKDSLKKAKETRAREIANEGKAGARVDEAAMGAARNMRRADILDKRSELTATQHDLLSAARQNLEDEIQALRVKAEEDLTAWRGKSAKEALYAMAQREEAERIRGLKKEAGIYKGKGERLTSADAAVDSAIKRIIDSDRNLSRGELEARAGEIIDRIVGTPDGRLPYDAASGGPRVGFTGDDGPAPRGSLAHRDFMIPDERLDKFGLLENDAGEVLGRMLQTMVPDVLMTERYGDVDLTQAFKRLREDHEKLSLAATDEKSRTALRNQYDEAVGDLAGVRDRIRGVFGWSGDYGSRNAARLAQAVKSYDFVTNMGGVALSSLPDMAGVVIRHGLSSTMANGWRPFLKAMGKMDGDAGAWKAARQQFQAMGIAAETMLATRVHAWQEVNAAYRPRSKFERALHSSSEGFAVASGLTLWTDVTKTIAGMTAQTEALKAITASVAGKATKKQITRLAEAGIDADMAQRIYKDYNAAGGGKVIDGIPFANSALWSDQGAREAFEGALARDIEIAVITPGQEKPLWLSKPVASVIGQYKSFLAAATERLLLAGLQQHDFQVLQGLMFSVALGMVSSKAYSVVTDTPAPERPQDWVKEGIHRSGVLGWFEEGNAIASKVTSGRADIFRLIGADKPLSRFQSRSILGALLGPTAGKIESLSALGGSLARGDWSESDTRRARRLFAFQNLFYIRRIIDQAEKGFNKALDIPEGAAGQQSYAEPTAQPNQQVAANQGGDIGSIMAALKAPRKLQTDMAGKVTGVAGADLPQVASDPRLQELLEMLKRPKKFETDAAGNVTGVSIA